MKAVTHMKSALAEALSDKCKKESGSLITQFISIRLIRVRSS